MDEPLSLTDARKLIASHICPGAEEIIPLERALHRRPFTNLPALIPVPHFSLSTMDGYAISSKSLAGVYPPLTLPIAGEIAAGCTQIPSLGSGEVIRIMTVGLVPAGTDNSVTIFRVGEQGQHIRPTGTDLRKGGLIIRKVEQINPFYLHLLATSGLTTIRVFSRPRISFLCTGSELAKKTASGPDHQRKPGHA